MKVISFALWGNDSKYVGGAEPNIRFAARWYPGWRLRVYCEPQHSRLMSGLGYEVVERRITKGSWEGLFWRFEPLLDRGVDAFISRDLDSRLNPRESSAVAEWLSSGTFAHVMRDHVFHGVPILGGMWGCRHSAEFGELYASMLDRWNIWDRLGCDQDFLALRIWPLIEHRVWVNDSVHKSDLIHPFPPHEPMDANVYGTEVGGKVFL